MQHHSQFMELVCLVDGLDTSVADRHHFPSGALIPDHTPVCVKATPSLVGTYKGLVPWGITDLWAYSTKSGQAASLFHKSLISYAPQHSSCPWKRLGVCCRPSQIVSAGQLAPYLGSCSNTGWVPLGRSPLAAGAGPRGLAEPISWLVRRANQLAGCED